NTATVSSDSPNSTPNDNTSTVTTPLTPQYDLAINKTADVSSIVPGQDNTVHYTIKVSNSGPSTAVGQTVTDTLSASTRLVSDTWTATANGGDSVTTASGTGNISDTVTLVPGPVATTNVTFNVTAIIHPAPAPPASVRNTATVSSDNPNSTPNDNT